MIDDTVEEGKKRALRKKLPDIIRTCKKLSRDKLADCITSAWDNFARYLKRFIDQAPDNDECFAYMVAADEINSKRDAVIAQFKTEFTNNFNEVLKAVIKRNQLRGISTDGLSLMDSSELEESLTTTKIVLFLQERFSDDLAVLEQRLQFLFGQYKLNSDNNPIGPGSIISALNRALHQVELDLKTKKVLYQLFGKHIVQASGPLYRELHEYFASEGVLPHLTPEKHAKRPKGRPRRSEEHSISAWINQQNAQADSESDAEYISPDQYDNIKQLLAKFQNSDQQEKTYIEVTPDLVDMLTTLQQVQISSGEFGENEGRELKSSILNEYNNLQAVNDNAETVNQLDSETIDMISVIFDYFLNNEDIPDLVKAMIARLQIPVIKVALIDRSFLNDKQHPARRFLNRLTEASLELDDDNETSRDRLYNKMETMVKTISNEFATDVDIFSKQLKDLEAFLDEEKHEYEEARLKLQKETEEADKQERAGKQAAQDIANRIVDKTVPDDVKHFLTHDWHKVITAISLKFDLSSDYHRNAIDFIDDLIWSVEPKTCKDERAKLISLLPNILIILRDGLESIEAPNEEIDATIKMLEKYHLASIRGAAQPIIVSKEQIQPEPEEEHIPDDIDRMLRQLREEVDAISEYDEDILMSGLSEPSQKQSKGESAFDQVMAEMGFDTTKDNAPQIEDEFTEQVRQLEPGTWMEFILDDGDRKRGKLAWKGDAIMGYTFVNRRYQVIADKSLFALAEDLRQGAAYIIESDSMFDKALDVFTGRTQNAMA